MLTLTPELLRVFIRRIKVYEKPIKYTRTCDNPMAIYYTLCLPEQDGVSLIGLAAPKELQDRLIAQTA